MSEEVDRPIGQEFQSDLIASPDVIDRETEERLQAVLHPTMTIQPESVEVPKELQLPEKAAERDSSQADPFA